MISNLADIRMADWPESSRKTSLWPFLFEAPARALYRNGDNLSKICTYTKDGVKTRRYVDDITALYLLLKTRAVSDLFSTKEPEVASADATAS